MPEIRLELVKIVLALSLIGVDTASAVAFDGQTAGVWGWGGNVARQFTPDEYRFSTFSYESVCPDSDYYCFYTRYRNDMKNADVRLDWYIPHHLAWVPAQTETAPQPRFDSDPNAKIRETCLEYGNTGRTVNAPLVLRYRELSSASLEELLQNCHTARARFPDPPLPYPPPSPTSYGVFKHPLDFFFPSDAANPQNTMLHFVGEVILKKEGAREGAAIIPYVYTTKIVYNVKRWRASGDAEHVRIRPKFTPVDVPALRSFDHTYESGGVQLDWEGTIQWATTMSSLGKMSSGLFEIEDEQQKVVATLLLPVFEESNAGPEITVPSREDQRHCKVIAGFWMCF